MQVYPHHDDTRRWINHYSVVQNTIKDLRYVNVFQILHYESLKTPQTQFPAAIAYHFEIGLYEI